MNENVDAVESELDDPDCILERTNPSNGKCRYILIYPFTYIIE